MNKQKTIRIKGSLIDLSTPAIMGIINATPDSFYKGSRRRGVDDIVCRADEMLNEGAAFLDIGGYSSRPGAEDISTEEEIRRIAGPIEEILKRFPEAVISVDTFRSDVARAAIGCGAAMVNDISGGGLDSKMFEVVAHCGTPYVCMHMRGTPQTMRGLTAYDDILKEITFFFAEKISRLQEAGVRDILLDPGFGFAKTVGQNYYLLDHLEYFHHLDKPLLVGVSRKSMIYKTLNTGPEEALNGTTVLNTVALLKGASVLRVHDVKEAAEVVKLVNELKS